jgi:predicted glycogen debranching enzyme
MDGMDDLQNGGGIPVSDLSYGRRELGDWNSAGRLEWFVGNGIGGFASGTVGGALTRRTHGLLFAALRPPLGRTLLLAKFGEQIEIDGTTFPLDSNLWASGAIDPAGFLHLESFRLEDSVPAWTWAIGDTRLEKRIWMERGENTTYVQYRLASGRSPVRLTLQPLVNHREAHDLLGSGEWTARVEPATGGLRIEAFEGATPLWLLAQGAEIHPRHDWHRGHALAAEREENRQHLEDHLLAGEIVYHLRPSEDVTVVASTRRDAGAGEAGPLALVSALNRRRAHDRSLVDSWKRGHATVARKSPDWVRQLVLAADSFLVEHCTPADPIGHGVVNGFESTGDWARDTLVALPGLTVFTGRPEIARSVLVDLAGSVADGLLPAAIADGEPEGRPSSVDAPLWLFQAVRTYHEQTRDDALLAEVAPALESILNHYEHGSRHGIAVDPGDKLLRVGDGQPVPTWWDAVAEPAGAPPRHGKPVELNALWYNALTAMTHFSRRLRRSHEPWEAKAKRVESSFARFWNPEAGCLFDVVDGPYGPDASVRPHQILALSLPDTPLTAAQRRGVLEACGGHLLTSHGLRGLSPFDPRYAGVEAGDVDERRRAAAHGSAWLWLLPHYALASERVTGDSAAALALLEPLGHLIDDVCVGFLPERADGDLPHRPRGSVTHGWAVAETLRAWHVIAGERPDLRRRAMTRAVERVVKPRTTRKTAAVA